MIGNFLIKSSREELEKLAYDFAPKLYKLAFTRLGNQQDAEDAVQDTYMKAFRNLPSYRQGTNMEAWLVQILLNTVRDFVRHSQVTGPALPLDRMDEGPPTQFTPSPEQEIVQAEVSEELMVALQSTPEWLLTPLLLRVIHDLSYKEVGQVLEIPIGTVMSRLSRARQFLRGKLTLTQGQSRTGGSAYGPEPQGKVREEGEL